MHRRRLIVSMVAAAAASLPAVVRAQTTASEGCSLGFVHGLLQYDPDCALIPLTSLGMEVAPPTHLTHLALALDGAVDAPVDTTATAPAGGGRGGNNNNHNNNKKKNNNDNKNKNNSNKKNNKKNGNNQKTVVVRGNGPESTKEFHLEQGRYRAIATYVTTDATGGRFFVDLHGPNGYVESVFIENPEDPGNYRYESIVDTDADGDYFFEVEEAGGSWEITLKPF
jgi:hypothetical protein